MKSIRLLSLLTLFALLSSVFLGATAIAKEKDRDKGNDKAKEKTEKVEKDDQDKDKKDKKDKKNDDDDDRDDDDDDDDRDDDDSDDDDIVRPLNTKQQSKLRDLFQGKTVDDTSFSPELQNLIQLQQYQGLPPGIVKQLQRGKPLPPGIAKRFAQGVLFPRDLNDELDLADQAQVILVGQDLFLVDPQTQVLVDWLKGFIQP